MIHSMCFVCSICKCQLDSLSYGCDLNGTFFCPQHMRSAQPSEQVYKFLARGYLRKQGKIVKKWRRRYFVLPVDSCELRYYTSEDLQEYRGSIDLTTVSNIQLAYLTVPKDKSNPLLPSGSLPAIQLVTPGRIWNLVCDTDSIRGTWRDALRQSKASYEPASPAASPGVGLLCDQHSGSSPVGHSPQMDTSSIHSSGLLVKPFSSSEPALDSPPSHTMPTIPRRPSSANPGKTTPSLAELSPSSFVSRDSDETNSPEDESAVTIATRTRRESGLGRGDGSAGASQSMASSASNAEGGGLRSKLTPPPIIIPTFNSVISTPMTGASTGVQDMSPETPGGKVMTNVLTASELVSPLTWQPTTPRNFKGKGSIVRLGGSRSRAASAGASLSPLTGQLSLPQSATQPIPGVPDVPPQEESLLCSCHH